MGKIGVLLAVMANELKIISREPGGLALLVVLPYFIAGSMAFIASFFVKVTSSVFIRQFIGFEVLMLSMIMVQTGSRFLWEERRGGGRLEFLLASPTSMYLILLGTSLVMIIVNIGAFTIASLPLFYMEYGLIGALRLALALLTLFIGLLPLYGIGLLIAGLVMRLNDADAVNNVITPILTILSGTTYPVYVLPWWIRGLVYALPMYITFYSMYLESIGQASYMLIIYLITATIIYLLFGMTSYAKLESGFRNRGGI
ncbi:ABC transporter permease [Vulcanisaeta distributa]|uniref:ABC transporter permease n=1 Tax=Vulcanisaeta distributa TaxID=164451 RepID=UPI000AF77F85|nr:ABC transporter permease [Vulcanisaeta distributa]